MSFERRLTKEIAALKEDPNFSNVHYNDATKELTFDYNGRHFYIRIRTNYPFEEPYVKIDNIYTFFKRKWGPSLSFKKMAENQDEWIELKPNNAGGGRKTRRAGPKRRKNRNNKKSRKNNRR
jgi:hypothetical protein